MPSSTGSCTQFVSTLPGTFLLCGLDKTGGRVPKPFAPGDTIAPLSTKIENDLLIPRLAFTDGRIAVAQWGYGSAWRPPLMTGGSEEQVFVFMISVNGTFMRGTFTIAYDPDGRTVQVKRRATMPLDEPLIIR